jgi:transcriptional regulator with XRE-family HTH domain
MNRPKKIKDLSWPSAVALRDARTRAGLSTYEAGRLLGLSQSSIKEAEQGSWHMSDSRLAELLAKYADREIGL